MLRRWDPRALPMRIVVRYLAVACLIAFAIANYMLWTGSASWDVTRLRSPMRFGSKHPIKKLMTDARQQHAAVLAKRSHTVEDAASKYRLRRGRHPPPGFDKWVEAAVKADSIVVEDYFDRIYKDLTPFWGLDTETVAKRASAWHWVVKVRNGTAEAVGNTKGRVPWLQKWTSLVKEFAEHLPDCDMPINYMDEPRVFVPFDEISKLVGKEQESRSMPDADKVTTKFKGLAEIDASNPKPYDPAWHGTDVSYWDLSAKTCGPDTPSHGVPALKDFSGPAQFPQNWRPSFSFKGFIQNFTASMDPCLQPHLRGLHGSFVRPLSFSSTTELIPLFGGSKLAANNEILIPGAMYLAEEDERYSGGDSHGPPWQRKSDGIVWRGVASGGRATDDVWHHFQRHRLLEMLNGTTVARVEEEGERALTFEMPSTDIYDSPRLVHKKLGAWLKEFSNSAFIEFCPPGKCTHYLEAAKIPMKEQYEYKFLPDVDGNSFSARFRGFLRSTSVPLKATAYAEWHDDRLVPWVHFIPLDNTFQDLYPVLEYFADGPRREGDTAARYIAESGQEWAEKNLRRQDMRIYVWRLLLEWARVCDENRATLGYVNDIKTNV